VAENGPRPGPAQLTLPIVWCILVCRAGRACCGGDSRVGAWIAAPSQGRTAHGRQHETHGLVAQSCDGLPAARASSRQAGGQRASPRQAGGQALLALHFSQGTNKAGLTAEAGQQHTERPRHAHWMARTISTVCEHRLVPGRLVHGRLVHGRHAHSVPAHGAPLTHQGTHTAASARLRLEPAAHCWQPVPVCSSPAAGRCDSAAVRQDGAGRTIQSRPMSAHGAVQQQLLGWRPSPHASTDQRQLGVALCPPLPAPSAPHAHCGAQLACWIYVVLMPTAAAARVKPPRESTAC